MGYTYSYWPESEAEPALAVQFSAIGALLVGIVWGRIVRVVASYRTLPTHGSIVGLAKLRRSA